MNIAEEHDAEVMPDEGRKDSKGRITLDGERRVALLDEYLASGLSQARFARKAGLTYSTFAGWVQRHRRSALETTPLRALKSSVVPTMEDASSPGRSLKNLKIKTSPCGHGGPASRIEFREVALPVAPDKTTSPVIVIVPGGIEARCVDAVTAARLIRALREVG